MKKRFYFVNIALMSSMLVCTSVTQAAFSDQDERAVSGTMACGGNHFNRLGGTETHNTRYILRNYGDTPVRIEQLTVYAADGSVLFSGDGTSLPPFVNGVLGPGDNVLNPNETANLRTEDFLNPLPSNLRPISMKIEWAADSRTLIPDFVWVRNTFRREAFDVDPQTGETIFRNRETRGRHLNNCRSVVINKGRKRRHHDDD